MKTVDVSLKPETLRYARAYGRIRLRPQTVLRIREGKIPKGDVLSACRLAGIMASKKTHEVLPFCHPLTFEHAEVDVKLLDDAIEVFSLVKGVGKTGYEMEALMAVSSALLCVYDMCKGLDDQMVIEEIRLLEKGGGKSQWSKSLEGIPVFVESTKLKGLIEEILAQLGAHTVDCVDKAKVLVSTEGKYIEKGFKGLDYVVNGELFKLYPQALKEGVSIGLTDNKLVINLQGDAELVRSFFEYFGSVLGNFLSD